jgi:hypothetical protein
MPASDCDLTLKGLSAKPQAVKLLADGSELKHDFANGTLTVHLPAEKRTKLVDVVAIDLAPPAVGG